MTQFYQDAGLVRIYDAFTGQRAKNDIPFSLSGENPHRVMMQLDTEELAGIKDATIEFCIRGYGAYGVDNILIRDAW